MKPAVIPFITKEGIELIRELLGPSNKNVDIGDYWPMCYSRPVVKLTCIKGGNNAK